MSRSSGAEMAETGATIARLVHSFSYPRPMFTDRLCVRGCAWNRDKVEDELYIIFTHNYVLNYLFTIVVYVLVYSLYTNGDRKNMNAPIALQPAAASHGVS
ncbi:hypothetical protein Y032_0436g1432 [Ancylostoma ceylanicum]|uniref:Uncharacterized protein n=1 Tax=Ancylostoma ceylanicum TaxID=53326 RepID=A0A016X010_9BILA|nr:hypothetical protein Y032_0436g1432 [Ancylostoma ceylanicum]